MMTASLDPANDRRSLRRLRRQWLLLGLAAGLFAAAGYAVLRGAWDPPYPARWLAATAALLLYQYGSLWKHLDENRLKGVPGAPLFPTLGLANIITLTRSVFFAGLVGFLLAPRPAGWLAWAPGALYLSGALLDYVDGYVARITRRTTTLGERLDMQWDSVGLLAAALLVVLYRQAPLPYLLVGLARYLYLFGLWLHRRNGGQVVDLPPSRFRRAMAGMQMGFVAVILLPVYGPPPTQIAAALFMLPTLISFVRDYLHVTGRIGAPALPQPRAASLLPIALRAGLILLLGSLVFTQLRQGVPAPGMLLVAGAAIPALLLGVTGRVTALAVLLMSGFGLRAEMGDARYWLILLLATALFMTGTGRYSLWSPEDWLIDHHAGEARGG